MCVCMRARYPVRFPATDSIFLVANNSAGGPVYLLRVLSQWLVNSHTCGELNAPPFDAARIAQLIQERPCAREIVYTQRTGWGLLPITKRGKSALSSGVRVKLKLCAFDARFAFFFFSLSPLRYKHTNAELYQRRIQTVFCGGKFRIITSGILSRDVFLSTTRRRHYFPGTRSVFRAIFAIFTECV